LGWELYRERHGSVDRLDDDVYRLKCKPAEVVVE
jgi:hypothetical protein